MRFPNRTTTAFAAMVSGLIALALLVPHFALAQYTISTVVGGGPNGLAALSASIGYPARVVYDAFDNSYLIADVHSSRVLEVSAGGLVTVVAGNGASGYSGDGGSATSATLGINGPEGLAVDASGNIFVADTDNSVIREVMKTTGEIQTVAGNFAAGPGYSGDGGAATGAQLDEPFGVFVDSVGNIFIADTFNSVIREVVASGGKIQTVAGNFQDGPGYSGDGGLATGAQLDFPEGVFVDALGNIFIADTDNSLVRAVNPGTTSTTIAGVTIAPGDIQTVAGAFYNSEGGTECAAYNNSGPALSVDLCGPSGVFVDGAENIFITDYGYSVVWEIAAPGSAIAAVAGNGTAGFSGDSGSATAAELNSPNDVFVDGSGDIFIADTLNSVIREVVGGNINTEIGNKTLADSGDGGAAVDAELGNPGGVFTDGSGNVFIADTFSSVIRELVAASSDVQTVAGDVFTPCLSPTAACGDGGPAASAQLNSPYGVALDGFGNIYIADTLDNRVRVVNTGAASITVAGVAIAPGDVATVAGDGTPGFLGDTGPATSAELFNPYSVFVDIAGNIFIADKDNHAIREVAAATGIITSVAGNGSPCPAPTTSPCGDGGLADVAQLNSPSGVFVDSSENVYIADTNDNRIRVINLGSAAVTIAGVTIQPGNIATVAGTGAEGYAGDGAAATSALLAGPGGLFVDASGDIVFSDSANFVVREVVSSSGFIGTIAGSGTQGFSGDGGPATSAEFTNPLGISGDSATGNLYVADVNSSRICALAPSALVAPTAPQPPSQTTSPGGTASYDIKLTANTGDPRYPITLSCLQSSLPANATCSFSPAKITPGPAPVPFTLTITVPSGSAALEKQNVTRPNGMRLQFVFAFVPLAGMLFAGVGAWSKRRRWMLLAALGVCLILLNACGGGSGSGSGSGTTYNVQVQGTTTAQPNPVTITTAVLVVQ